MEEASWNWNPPGRNRIIFNRRVTKAQAKCAIVAKIVTSIFRVVPRCKCRLQACLGGDINEFVRHSEGAKKLTKQASRQHHIDTADLLSLEEHRRKSCRAHRMRPDEAEQLVAMQDPMLPESHRGALFDATRQQAVRNSCSIHKNTYEQIAVAYLRRLWKITNHKISHAGSHAGSGTSNLTT
jgi:hypothetical protein